MNFDRLENAVRDYGDTYDENYQRIINQELLKFVQGFAYRTETYPGEEKIPETPKISYDHWMSIKDFVLIAPICSRSSITKFLHWKSGGYGLNFEDPNFAIYAKGSRKGYQVLPRELILALSTSFMEFPLMAAWALQFIQKNGW